MIRPTAGSAPRRPSCVAGGGARRAACRTRGGTTG